MEEQKQQSATPDQPPVQSTSPQASSTNNDQPKKPLMTRQKRILWLAGIIFTYIAFAIIGFFAVYFIKNLWQGPPETVQTTSNEPTASPAAGFTNYEIAEEKVTISYPEELEVEESSYGLGVKTVELRSPDNADPDYAADFQILRAPKYMAKAIGQDFESFFSMADGETKIIESPMDDSRESFTKVRNRTIDGLNAVEYTSVPQPNPEDYDTEIGVIIEGKDNLIIITTGESYREEFETMLQSFNAQ